MSDAAAAASAYRSSRRRWAFLIAALAIAVVPYVLTGSYWHTNLTICAINVLLALGLDFILGYAGQLNLGQSAFYGLGAYVSTLLVTRLGVPFWGAFIAGVAFAGLSGVFLALFAVRLRGHYLAIASLGFAVIVHQILLNWIGLTQGPLGINAAAWKVFAFGIGASVGGAAGCFYAPFVGTLVPDAFFIAESFGILSM